MRKRLREHPEPEKEEPLVTYGRPSVSSWVAAAAVAFAFFVLGGFIKTYSQLEELREESRQEIDDLHDSVRMLQSQLAMDMRNIGNMGNAGSMGNMGGGGMGGNAPGVRDARPMAQGYRVQPLPPARRERVLQDEWEEPPPPQREQREQPEQRQEMRAGDPLLPERSARLPDPGLVAEFEKYGGNYGEERESKPRARFGRLSNEGTRQLLTVSGTPCQVTSVSGVNKRLMIEGGRDLSLAEGARLELCRDGRWIGDLRVVDVFDNQSSCEVLHATVPPEPGDTVRRAQR